MNPPSRTPSRASTLAAPDSKTRIAQHAALSGATKAFGRPVPQQRGSTSFKLGTNESLAAAASVGSRPGSPQGRQYARSPVRPLVASSTGGSVQSMQSTTSNAPYPGKAPNLQPQQTRAQHSKSPSLQAASLAASRATPQPQQSRGIDKQSSTPRVPVSKPAAPPKPRRLSEQHGNTSLTAPDISTDDTSIPPTTSLVRLFEQKASEPQRISKRPDPIVVKPDSDLAIRSPKPLRSSGGGLTSVFQLELPDENHRSTAATRSPPSPSRSSASSGGSFASASESATAPVSPEANVSGKSVIVDPPTEQDGKASQHQAISGRRVPSPPAALSSSARPISVQKLPSRSGTAISEKLSPSSASIRSIPAQYNQLHPRNRPPKMTGDQLANAIVASSLASSRRPSPQHTDPPPLPSRRQKHHTFGFSRTPSPTKGGFKHTLRKEESESESDDDDSLHPYGKHRRKRHLRPKHPNKHHEGDRKRWRDAVTEREKKRYEGVWAANKGLHCSFTPSEQVFVGKSPNSEEARTLQAAMGEQISNIVARDIWQRSRLTDATLEAVWDLVDNECVGRLTKDEFVVAMFLIDYCLKGRKLPAKVSESVWASVRGLHGIKIKKKYV